MCLRDLTQVCVTQVCVTQVCVTQVCVTRCLGVGERDPGRARYLWLEVPVHHAHVVHVADGRLQPSHDAAGLRLAEVLLPTARKSTRLNSSHWYKPRMPSSA